MKILREAGTFEILEATPNALQLIEQAGRTCYKSFDKITDDSADKFVRMLIGRGHESVLEHAHMVVRFTGHSRGFTHELVRHRLCGYSQESTRYVDESDLHFVVPPGTDEDSLVGMLWPDELKQVFGSTAPTDLTVREMVLVLEMLYRSLRAKKWKPEDARQFLPIGTQAEIVHSANFREWRHIFRMRCAKAAHWEIRRTMRELLRECIDRWPPVFDDLSDLLWSFEENT